MSTARLSRRPGGNKCRRLPLPGQDLHEEGHEEDHEEDDHEEDGDEQGHRRRPRVVGFGTFHWRWILGPGAARSAERASPGFSFRLGRSAISATIVTAGAGDREGGSGAACHRTQRCTAADNGSCARSSCVRACGGTNSTVPRLLAIPAYAVGHAGEEAERHMSACAWQASAAERELSCVTEHAGMPGRELLCRRRDSLGRIAQGRAPL